MSHTTITGNYFAKNLADCCDTATPGNVGINISSGGGGSPITDMSVTYNTITDEDVDIAINTPAPVDVHYNDLLGGKIGIADVCAYDGATICTGTISATQNYWGCPQGPGAALPAPVPAGPAGTVPSSGGPGGNCTTVNGSNIVYVPWSTHPVAPGH